MKSRKSLPLILALFLLPACGGAQSAEPESAERPTLNEAEIAERSSSWDSPGRDAWQRPDEVLRLLGAGPGMIVADLGAGTGYFLPHLSEAVGPSGRVIALEVDPGLVEHMRERVQREGLTNVEVRLVEADDPGLGHGSVHRILVLDTWPYLENLSIYVNHLHRGLAAEGQILVVDHTEDSTHGPPESLRLVPHEVVTRLRSEGFAAEQLMDAELPNQFAVRGTHE